LKKFNLNRFTREFPKLIALPGSTVVLILFLSYFPLTSNENFFFGSSLASVFKLSISLFLKALPGLNLFVAGMIDLFKVI